MASVIFSRIYLCYVLNIFLATSLYLHRHSSPTEPYKMPAPETQDESKTKNTVYNFAATCFGKEVSTKAVSFNSWKSGVLGLTELDGNASKNLVSESSSKSKKTSWSRARKTKTGQQAIYATKISVDPWRIRLCMLWTVPLWTTLGFPAL